MQGVAMHKTCHLRETMHEKPNAATKDSGAMILGAWYEDFNVVDGVVEGVTSQYNF